MLKFLSITLMFVSAFGAPQLIGNSLYYPVQPTINPSDRYVLVYPQHQFLLPREGEGGEGGGFWQSVINYFGCEGGESLLRTAIPPTIDTKLPDKEVEKLGTTSIINNEDKFDEKPLKPFYYVLPPSPGLHYYYPQTSFVGQSNIFPKFNGYNPFSINTKSTSGVLTPRTKEINDQVKEDLKSYAVHTKEKH